ncbi:MAG: methyl-accepting chemotaxis protein [Eubacteriales bacterium]|nr:methyl-accepting chemotaxis protein [Eubacteriales bacterium]
MNEKLKSIVDNLDAIRMVSDGEVYLTVVDKDGVVLAISIPEGQTPVVEIGVKFNDPTGAIDEVLRLGREKHNILPKDVVGKEMEGNIVPIKDGVEVVGCLISTYASEDRNRTQEIAKQLQKSVGDVNDSLQGIVGGLEDLFNMLTDMNQMTADIEKDVSGAADVVNKVSGNASRSNILALNASIEAARSGEAGRGFAVVATEMGKLANESGSSASAIKSTLDVIAEHLQAIIKSIKEANGVAKEHMESINEIKDILIQTIDLSSQLGK